MVLGHRMTWHKICKAKDKGILAAQGLDHFLHHWPSRISCRAPSGSGCTAGSRSCRWRRSPSRRRRGASGHPSTPGSAGGAWTHPWSLRSLSPPVGQEQRALTTGCPLSFFEHWSSRTQQCASFLLFLARSLCGETREAHCNCPNRDFFGVCLN